ncbi:hypothetical protein T10_12527 [Trichinella papuae]|uniref:Uncharacterized protein n=1 Tax=Trichinella papuae TaxID=268474 RepID=A0A0V1MDR8_9BILA|nr:hypothetical protein T10_4940 [Trichinella papuae]KRZ69729.1 hypothetical protein T10_12527 [Trichinella papuae]
MPLQLLHIWKLFSELPDTDFLKTFLTLCLQQFPSSLTILILVWYRTILDRYFDGIFGSTTHAELQQNANTIRETLIYNHINIWNLCTCAHFTLP